MLDSLTLLRDNLGDGFVSVLTVLVPGLIIAFLVFIHELGHFLAARSVGVRVEEFAIGFGPRILQKKIGNTIYSIRAFLLGGFVQMFGDLDPSSSVKNESLRKHPDSLLSKSLSQKVFVLSAGVLMNFLFGIILFVAYLGAVDGVVAFKRIGDYKFIGGNEYPMLIALSQDFRDDKSNYGFILRLNDEIIDDRAELVLVLEENVNKPVKVEIQTKEGVINENVILNGDGVKSNLDLDILPFGSYDDKDVLYARAYITKISDNDGIFAKAKIAGTEVTLPDGRKTAITVADREEEFLGSYIVRLGEVEINSTKKLDQAKAANAGKETEMQLISKDGKSQKIIVNIPAGTKENDPVFGVQLSYSRLGVNSDFFLYRYDNAGLGAVAHGVNTAGYQGYALGVLIGRAFQGNPQELSDNVGGVVALGDTIGGVVSEASSQDSAILVELLNITATISIVLAFMNILPIPVLDGGHILFAVLEKLRGKPLPANIENTIYLIFFVVLIFLSVLITARDIIRLV